MRNIILFIAIIFVFALNLNADMGDDLFKKANDHYMKEEYSTAIDKYEELLEQGYKTSELYYNLGNAYFKSNMIPSAILNFERAKKLAPGDEDINFNLKIANLQTIDKITPMPEPFFREWWHGIKGILSSGMWGAASVVAFWIGAFAFITFLYSGSTSIKKISFALASVFIIVTFVSFIFAFQTYNEEVNVKEAIVFAESSYVKTSPDEASTDLVILHEGTKLTVLDSLGEWKKIKLPDGNIGWIVKTDIEMI
jgi:tetratricopeptide (TPR) repeat protein